MKQLKQMQTNNRRKYRGILLDCNERTVPLSQSMLENINQAICSQDFLRYPDYFDVTADIARYAGVRSDQVWVTNGSDQAIDLIFRTFTQQGDTVIIPKPTFSMFFHYANLSKTIIVSPKYNELSGEYPIDEVISSINVNTKLIVICNPNNPTGTIVNLDIIKEITEKMCGGLVLIDEAYFEFSELTAVSLVNLCPNIVITRTFSKAFGLAGLRIGYLLANEKTINQLKKTQGPYDVNRLACMAAVFALNDLSSVQQYVSEVNRAKLMLTNFFSIQKIKFYRSSGNFILFKLKDAKSIFELLNQSGVLLKQFSEDSLRNCLRISVGSMEDVRKFINIYKKVVLRKYAFLDRDGTLIYEPQDAFQIDSLDKLTILDGVIASLQKLCEKGYRLIMVSNQNGVGSPAFPQENFEAPQKRLLEIFRDNNIEFEKIFICPHMPSDDCCCRKPKTGLVDEFIEDNRDYIDIQESFMCGDRESDRIFAENIGISYKVTRTNCGLDLGE